MAQYKTGTVDVTNGSAVVTGNGTLWNANVSAGDGFIRTGDGVTYDIASVDSDTQITLSTPYAGTTGSAVSYAITRDFTTNLNLPELTQGDLSTATVFTRAMRLLDSADQTKQAQIDPLQLAVDQKAIFDRATLDFDYQNGTYLLNQDPVVGLTQNVFEDVHAFARDSAATVDDARKVIRDALSGQPRFKGNREGLFIEGQRTNLLEYPRRFDQSAWVKDSGGTGSTPIVIPNYKGAAYRVQFDKGAGSTQSDYSRLVQQSVSTIAGTHAYSFRIKSTDGVSSYNMEIRDFSLNGVELITVTGEYQTFTLIHDAGSSLVNIALSLRGGRSPASSQTADVIIEHAQLEEGSFPTSVVPDATTFTSRSTTATYYDSNGVLQTAGVDVARDSAYGWFNGTLYFIGLLLEQASENLLLYSEEFDNAAWNKFQAIITADSIAAPDNATTADTLTASANGQSAVRQSVTISNATTYTTTFHAKKGNVDWCRVQLGWSSNKTAYFDLANGVFGTVDPGLTVRSEFVGDGWYEINLTAVSTGTSGNNQIEMTESDAVTNATTGNFIYIWGAQLEEQPYATSYIPTAGTTVTRAADVSSSSAATRSQDNALRLLGDEFNPKAFTIFCEFSLDQIGNGFSIIGTNESNNNPIYMGGSGVFSADFRASGGAVYGGTTLLTEGTTYKAAVAVTESSVAAAIDGAQEISQTGLTLDIEGLLTTLYLLQREPFSVTGGIVKKLRLLPEALTQSELETITSG